MLHQAHSLPAAHTGSLWRTDLGNSTEPTKCSSASRTPWFALRAQSQSDWAAGRESEGDFTERSTSTTAVAVVVFPEIFWVIQSGLGASLGGAVVAGQWELGCAAGQPICWDKGQPRWMLTRRLNSKMTQSTACWNLLQSKVRPLHKACVVNGRRRENGEQLGTFQTVRGTLFEEDKAWHFFTYSFFLWSLTFDPNSPTSSLLLCTKHSKRFISECFYFDVSFCNFCFS